MKIIKSISEKTEFELENGTHVTSFASWDALSPYIKYHMNVKHNERILGYRIDENGVTAIIGKK